MSSCAPKRGVVLVREANWGKWVQKVLDFDPQSGTFTLSDPVEGNSMTLLVKDRKAFHVKPSPYTIPQYPMALALHLYPLFLSRDDEEGRELHISSLERKDMLDWSYYFQSYVSAVSHAINVSVLPPLSEEEERVSQQLLGGQADQQVLVDKFNIPVTKKTLTCLKDLEWLSDEVVNFYFALVQERAAKRGTVRVFCWTSFFFSKLVANGYSGVKNWTSRKQIDLFADTDLILIPVHVVDHWALGVVDLKNKTTQYLDSLGASPESLDFHSVILEYLRCEFGAKRPGSELDTKAFKRLAPPTDLPLQSNGSDCGVFICMYALVIAAGLPVTSLGSPDVDAMRRRMAVDIVRGKIRFFPRQN